MKFTLEQVVTAKIGGKYIAVLLIFKGDRGSTVVKVLSYKSEGHWFDPSWCQWIFH